MNGNYYYPSEDAIKELKPWRENDDHLGTLEDVKIELLVYCLQEHNPEDLAKVIKEIRFKLSFIKTCTIQMVKTGIYNQYQEEKEIYLDPYTSYESNEEAINSTLESLAILAYVKPNDSYFKVESDYFDKINEIKSQINGFVDAIIDLYEKELQKKWEEFTKVPENLRKELGIEENEEVD